MFSRIFSDIKTIEGCKTASLRLDWENAETVYVELLDDGRFRIYDRYETLAALRNNPDNYLTPHEFGIDRIRSICARYDLQLIDFYPNGFETEEEQTFAIVGNSAESTVAQTAANLADAIDQIFAESMEAKEQRTKR
ncbi:MAG: hypothetical protein IT422_15060 [Pirellulaceae bacterium]|nr:hypothetical protein [Pirellulaceae bacterium]